MKIIIGLGNPGEKYVRNRHNTGFIVIDKLRKKWDFPEFKLEKKFNSDISEGLLKIQNSKSKILLIKPQTFMNRSGEAVQKILSFYNLTPSDLVLIHDDLDIEIGNYKISKDSSAAGHNGIQDIFDKLGTQEIKRMRVGVEIEGGRENRKLPGEAFVLQDFTDSEYEKVIKLTKEISKELFQFQRPTR